MITAKFTVPASFLKNDATALTLFQGKVRPLASIDPAALDKATRDAQDSEARRLGFDNAAARDAAMAKALADTAAADAEKARLAAEKAKADAQAKALAGGLVELNANLKAWELDAFNWRQRRDLLKAQLAPYGAATVKEELDLAESGRSSALRLVDPATSAQLALFRVQVAAREVDRANVRALLAGTDSSPEMQEAYAANKATVEPRLRALLTDGDAPATAAGSSSGGFLILLALLAKFGGLL